MHKTTIRSSENSLNYETLFTESENSRSTESYTYLALTAMTSALFRSMENLFLSFQKPATKVEENF